MQGARSSSDGLTTPLHRIAVRLRFGMNVKGYSVGGGPGRQALACTIPYASRRKSRYHKHSDKKAPSENVDAAYLRILWCRHLHVLQ